MIPDYSTDLVKETEEKVGDFVYEQDEAKYGTDLITKGPYELDNGAIFQGQWTVDGVRQGRGIQIWKDG